LAKHSPSAHSPLNASIVAKGQGLYYGLARDNLGDVWVAARKALVSDQTPSWDERGTLLNLNSASSQPPVSVAPTQPLRDLHGIAVYNNTLWCTCSFDDAIAICALPEQAWTWWRPLTLGDTNSADQFHFNTLMFEAEWVWVLAHCRGPSWLMAFPLTEALLGRTVAPLRKIQLGQQAHNIWRHDGELRTCSSGEGALLGENGWRLETGGFPRGVAKLSDGWVVGISELNERQDRDLSSARLNFCDANWQQTRQITIPQAGMVLDIITIPRSLQLPVVGTQPVFAG